MTDGISRAIKSFFGYLPTLTGNDGAILKKYWQPTFLVAFTNYNRLISLPQNPAK